MSKNNEMGKLSNKTKKIIDNLYMKVSGRYVDTEGTEFFGTMLKTGRITKNDIVNDLLRSHERLINQKNRLKYL